MILVLSSMVKLGLTFAQYRSQWLKPACEPCAGTRVFWSCGFSPDQTASHRPDPQSAATSAQAVQAISSIGDVTRARKSPGTGASTDSLVVIVLYDTSLRRQRPCP